MIFTIAKGNIMERDDYKKTGLDEVSDDELKNLFGRDSAKDLEEDKEWEKNRIEKEKKMAIACFVCGIIGYFFVTAGCCLLPLNIISVALFIVSIVMGQKSKRCKQYLVLRVMGFFFSYSGLFAAIVYTILSLILGVGFLGTFFG